MNAGRWTNYQNVTKKQFVRFLLGAAALLGLALLLNWGFPIQ